MCCALRIKKHRCSYQDAIDLVPLSTIWTNLQFVHFDMLTILKRKQNKLSPQQLQTMFFGKLFIVVATALAFAPEASATFLRKTVS